MKMRPSNGTTLKTPAWCKILGHNSYTSRIIAHFVLKFQKNTWLLCHHGQLLHMHRRLLYEPVTCTLCLSKTMHQLWNGIAWNYKDRFWWHLAVIFKILWNRVCMFQFSCRFAFLSTSRLSNLTPKIVRILMLDQANAPTLMRCNV